MFTTLESISFAFLIRVRGKAKDILITVCRSEVISFRNFRFIRSYPSSYLNFYDIKDNFSFICSARDAGGQRILRPSPIVFKESGAQRIASREDLIVLVDATPDWQILVFKVTEVPEHDRADKESILVIGKT